MRNRVLGFVVLTFLAALVSLAYAPRIEWTLPTGSPATPVPDPAIDDVLVIEDFENSPVGGYPVNWGYRDGWGIKKLPEKYTDQIPYQIRQENGNKYLHADDSGQSVTLAREAHWNLHEYPCLTWRWRIIELPDADEKDGRNDSGGGVYITFSTNFFNVPKSIKYIWSKTVDRCEYFHRGKVGRPWLFVLETGDAKKGKWVTETVNLYNHYKKIYGGTPPKKPVGIAILSDASSKLGTHAIADYDDFKAQKTCSPTCN